jgi:hypothetical protein
MIMYNLNFIAVCAILLRVSVAQLSKPPLQPNLDNLNQGLLDNLHAPEYTLSQWPAGWIAQDCATMTSGAKLNPADVQTYNVQYADVSSLICGFSESKLKLVDIGVVQ